MVLCYRSLDAAGTAAANQYAYWRIRQIAFWASDILCAVSGNFPATRTRAVSSRSSRDMRSTPSASRSWKCFAAMSYWSYTRHVEPAPRHCHWTVGGTD